MTAEIVPGSSPNLAFLLSMQLEVLPDQQKFFERRFGGLDEVQLNRIEELARHVARLVAGREREFAVDYAWLCQEILAEELFFRRHKRYRRSSFKDAFEQVYSDPIYMTRYMNGVLMTQLWWSNHTDIIFYYRNAFLATNPVGYSHLEIGPGHGLLLFFAAFDRRAGQVEAWDVSSTSINLTQNNLRMLGILRSPLLRVQDVLDWNSRRYDSIVCSEVLEHLQEPALALSHLRNLLTPKGRLFINMPINSPAPDHLFNLESPEALLEFVTSHGFVILDHANFAGTNWSLEVARKKRLTISCAMIARAM